MPGRGGRKRACSLGNRSPPSPSSNRPEKLAKTTMEYCWKCGTDPMKVAMTCGGCNYKFCTKCCSLGEALMMKVNCGQLKGLVWKCDPCLKTTSSIEGISSKLTEMEHNNKERNDDMIFFLDEMEARITTKVLAEIPSMIKEEMKKFEEKLEEKIDKSKK